MRGALLIGLVSAAFAVPAWAQSGEGIARDLANPLSTLTRLPLELDWDRKVGPGREGERVTLRALPTLPIDLNRDLNLISRTDVRLVGQSDVAPGAGEQFGFGDVIQHLLFSPKRPSAGGLLWGAGPALLLPTGTDGRLTSKKYGLGPTGAVVFQDGAVTYGVEGHHLWSVAGDKDRTDVSVTRMRPFAAYTTRDAWTFGLDLDSTYDWKAKQGITPATLSVSKVTSLGGRPVSLGGGLRHYLDSTDSGPHGWAFRVSATFVFP